jgi:hypothetical protein
MVIAGEASKENRRSFCGRKLIETAQGQRRKGDLSSWGDHAQKATSIPVEQSTLELFQSEPLISCAAQVMDMKTYLVEQRIGRKDTLQSEFSSCRHRSPSL